MPLGGSIAMNSKTEGRVALAKEDGLAWSGLLRPTGGMQVTFGENEPAPAA